MTSDGEIELRFSADHGDESFKLLELPPDLLKLVTSTPGLELEIKGAPESDAVLCTADKTYAVRSVVLSNTMAIVTPQRNSDALVVRDELHEIIELTSTVPRLHALDRMLKGTEYDEGTEDAEEDGLAPKGIPFEQVRADIQASSAELAAGLVERRILNLNGLLRPIAVDFLSRVLELLLALLVSQGFDSSAAPVEELVSTLQDEHDINRAVCDQVMRWFGSVDDNVGLWKVDVEGAVKQIGLGLARSYRHNPVDQELFLKNWSSAVGDTFTPSVSLSLLTGNILLTASALSASSTLVYFPASELSTDPMVRFTELFSVRPKWTGEEIQPYLVGVAPEKKDRERLLIKYARAVPDTTVQGGVVYIARAGFAS